MITEFDLFEKLMELDRKVKEDGAPSAIYLSASLFVGDFITDEYLKEQMIKKEIEHLKNTITHM